MDLDAVGKSFGPFTQDYDERDLIFHALAVGADETELPFLYEKHGPRVLPSFTVAPAFKAAVQLVPVLGLGGQAILHGEQEVRILGPVPRAGRLETGLRLNGIYDKGSGAVLDWTCATNVDGKPVAENRGSFFVPGKGGFGGDRGPRSERHPPPDREPDHRWEQRIGSRQGILYRTTLLPDPAALEQGGDPHVDPEMARSIGWERPLLHGICTFGYLARAVVKAVCSGDPAQVSMIRVRFAGPVVPGDSLVAELWETPEGVVAQMRNQRGEVVLSDGRIELA